MMQQRIINIEERPIICIGDVHGEFPTLRFRLEEKCKRYGLDGAVFIVLGDCGFFGVNYDSSKWFHAEQRRINNILREHNCDLYLFRGNHDNPEIFNEEYILDGLTTDNHIHVLNDYDVIQSDIYGKILIVPGAFSVDRSYREAGRTWWRDEAVKRLPDSDLFEMEHYDLVLSHSLPYYNKSNKDDLSKFAESDHRLFRDEDDEFYKVIEGQDTYLQKLQKSIGAKMWISGHYHKHDCEILDDVKYITLSIMEFFTVPGTEEYIYG